MTWGVVAASVISAGVGIYSSKKAAKAEKKAAQQGIDSTNALIGPYSQAGTAGLPAVQSFVDNGARFSDTQAYKDITNSSKAGGANMSGNRATALTDYYATNFRPQRLNELMQLPTIGANASAGQSTQLNALYGAQGNAQANGIYGAGLAAQNALGSYAYLQNYKGSSTGQNNLSGYTVPGSGGQTPQQFYSDLRLKTDIAKVGEQDGINIYAWKWNNIAIEKGITSPTIGVIAQEIDSEYVREKDGYLQVNYGDLFPDGITEIQ